MKKDKVTSQTFRQRGINQWIWEYTTESNKKFIVTYTLSASGHVNEKVWENGTIKLDRDLRIGMNIPVTVTEMIEEGWV